MFKLDKCLTYLQKLGENETNHTLLHAKLNKVESFIGWLRRKNLIREHEYNRVFAFINNLKTTKTKEKATSNISGLGSVKPIVQGKVSTSYLLKKYAIQLTIVIFVFTSGVFLLIKGKNNTSVHKVLAANTGRVISYTGVIKEPNGNPIDYKTDLIFKLYSQKDSSAPLYAGTCLGENGITPKYNGRFSILIGQDCDMHKIPDEIFTNYNDLYLGITIGNDVEMTPRQQIPKVGYAVEAQKLKGFTVGTTAGNIPYIDENGVLLIDASSPKLRTVSGNFTLEGEMITLQTQKSKGGSIVLSPDKNTIVASGNLGIGTHNPRAALDVVGDASISGDLTFSNTFSQINLMNQADLVFNTTNSRKQLIASLVLANNGNVGIGTLSPQYGLTLEKNAIDSSVSSMANNTSIDSTSTNVLRLGLAVDKDSTKSNFIEFFSNTSGKNGTKVGGVRINNGGVVYETGGADFAEYFTSNNDLVDGDIVTTTSNGVDKAQDGQSIVGVISSTAGFVGNSKEAENKVIVGLLGQIETNVSNINGDISVGDKITTSSLRGYGAKAILPGDIVGTALSSINNTLLSNDSCPVQYRAMVDLNGNRVSCGKVKVLVNVSAYQPTSITNTPKPFILTNGSLNLENINNVSQVNKQISSLQNSLKIGQNVLTNIFTSAKIFAAEINVGLVSGVNIVVEQSVIAKDFVGEKLNVNMLKANKITSPIIESDKIVTKDITVEQIKPKQSRVEIDLSAESSDSAQFAELAIKGLNGTDVASIDNAGNATFSGTIRSNAVEANNINVDNLTSDNINSKEASISGQLTAREVKADNISNLEGSVSELKSTLQSSNSQLTQLKYDSTELTASLSQLKSELLNKNVQEITNPAYYQRLPVLPATSSAELATNLDESTNLDALNVTGMTNMYGLTVADKLTVGKLIVKDDEILSLAWDLKLTALSRVSFFDGLVTIAKDGSLTTTGKVIAKGGLETNTIESIDSDLSLKLKPTQSVATGRKFSFINTNNEEIASIDNSGNGKFQKIAVDSYQGASSEADLISSEENFNKNGIFAPGIETNKKSAGVGIIPTGTKEVVIYNSNINDNSLIYTTPTTKIQSSLAVVEKQSCSEKSTNVCKPYFIVSHGDTDSKNIQFNWFIVN